MGGHAIRMVQTSITGQSQVSYIEISHRNGTWKTPTGKNGRPKNTKTKVMPEPTSDQRDLGTITKAGEGESHGIAKYYVTIEFVGGVSQDFGGVIMTKDLTEKFRLDLARLFDLDTAKNIESQLIGRRCYALRGWGDIDDRIAGLESILVGPPNSRIMTLEGWRKRYSLKSVGTPLEERKNRIKHEIQWLLRRLDRKSVV